MSGFVLHALGKIIFIGIIATVWQVFVAAEATNILTYGQWFFSQSVYRVFTYSMATFLLDTVFFFSTIKILLWVFAPGAHDTENPKPVA